MAVAAQKVRTRRVNCIMTIQFPIGPWVIFLSPTSAWYLSTVFSWLTSLRRQRIRSIRVSSSKPTLNPQRWIGQTSFSDAVSTHRSTWWWHLEGCTWATEGGFEVRFLSSAESIEKTVEIFILLLKTLLNWSNFHQQQRLRTERVAIERWDLACHTLSTTRPPQSIETSDHLVTTAGTRQAFLLRVTG